jgi:hypothetical protein
MPPTIQASRPRHRLRLAALAALPVASLLSGCTAPDEFAPACPALALLNDGADLTRFRPGNGRDVTDLVLDARLTEVPASCHSDGPRKVAATLHVTADLHRGPAATTRDVAVPYFVSIVSNGTIIQEADYTLRSSFPPNIDRIRVNGDDIDMVFPVTSERSAAAYKIYVSFRLTPEELAYNRGRAR